MILDRLDAKPFLTWVRLLLGLGLFIVGVIVGAALVASWSLKASRLYLQRTRFSFALEQEKLLGQAWVKGEFAAAVGHAACQVEADRGGRAFDPVYSRWDLFLPLLGAVAGEDAQWGVVKGTVNEAIAHVQLAEAWKRLGRHEEANQEYAEAKRITGLADITKLREAALRNFEQAAQLPP